MAEQTTNRARPEEADKDAAQLTPDEVTTLVNFAELIRTAEAKAAKHQAPARPGFGLVVAVCDRILYLSEQLPLGPCLRR